MPRNNEPARRLPRQSEVTTIHCCLGSISLIGWLGGCALTSPTDPIAEPGTATSAGGSGGSMGGSALVPDGGSSAGASGMVGVDCDQVELLQDGSFDEQLGVWTEQSSNMEDLVREVGRLGAVNMANSGNWAAWLGGKANEVSILAQGVIVPRYAQQLTISGYYGIINPDAGDAGVVALDDGEGTVATWTPPQAVVPWEPFDFSVDVRDHANMPMTFMLGFTTDSIDPVASLYFDSVSLIATVCD